MSSDYSTIQQYQPLRVPQGWERQEKALIVQLEEILDDIYRRFGRLRLQDMNKEFRSSFADLEGNVVEITTDVSGLKTRMSTAEGNISELTLTASGLSTRMSTAEGNISDLSLTASGLTTRMETAEGDISSLELTASGLTTRVENAEGTVAQVVISTNAMSSKIGNWTSQSSMTEAIAGLDSRISSLGYGTVYMQPEEPSHAELVAGDIWIQTQSSGTWSEVYSDYATWQTIYNDVSTWQTLGGVSIMWVWDGRKWQKQLDSLEGDTLETEIQQNATNIQLLANRATAAEGDIQLLSASLDVANDAISAEVTRATLAENGKYTIRSGIDIKAEGIDISGSQYVKIASGGVFQVTTGNFGINSGASDYVIWSGASTAANSSFWVKKDGTIKATAGTIGGFTLGANSMTSGSGSAYIGLNTSTSETYAIWAGNATAGSAPFSVKKSGEMKATSGSIGGWTLAANSMASGSGSTYMNLNSNSGNTYAIWAGNETSSSAPFRVKRDGTLYVTSLVYVNESGVESTVNLRTAGLWKLSYNVIKTYTVSGGYCTAMTLSNGTTVNFKQAADARAEGWAAAANAVTAVTFNTVNHKVWLYVPTTTYNQTAMVDDDGVAYAAGVDSVTVSSTGSWSSGWRTITLSNGKTQSIQMPGTSEASWNRSPYGTSGRYIYSCTVGGRTYTHTY